MKGPNKIILAAVALIVVAGVIFAIMGHRGRPQGVGGPPMPGQSTAGPMGGPPGDPTQTADFQKTHKYTIQLMKLLVNVGRMEDAGKATLTPAQAKSLLKIVQPLREQKSLEEEAARKAVVEVQTVLTDDQRSAISVLPAERQMQQAAPPQGPPPSGGPSGPPPAMGGKPNDGFNPLSAPPGGPGGSHRTGPIEKLFNDLKSRSSQA